MTRLMFLLDQMQFDATLLIFVFFTDQKDQVPPPFGFYWLKTTNLVNFQVKGNVHKVAVKGN